MLGARWIKTHKAAFDGMSRLNWTQRPEKIGHLQAAAAVGQMGLVQTYETSFKRFNRQTAQILLNHDDMANRERYLNARSTLQTLLSHSVIPIVNENDTGGYAAFVRTSWYTSGPNLGKADVVEMQFDLPDFTAPHTQPSSTADGIVAHEMVHLMQYILFLIHFQYLHLDTLIHYDKIEEYQFELF